MTPPRGSQPWVLHRRYAPRFDTEAAADAFMASVETGTFGPKPVSVLAPHVAGRPILPEGRDAWVLAPEGASAAGPSD